MAKITGEINRIERLHSEAADVDFPVKPMSISGTDKGPRRERLVDNDEAARKNINRRFDLTILPLLALMNFLSSIDKGNIGNAQAAGMTKSIGVSPNAVNDSISFYYVTFLIFQPWNAFIAHKFGSRFTLGALMLFWGCMVVSNAFVKTYSQIIGVRMTIGYFESGFVSICIFYLSDFYDRFDLTVRVNVFFGLTATSGAFSGAIAYGILQIKGALHGWKYLFIMEGTLTIFIAILCTLALPSRPQTAWMLHKADRDLVKQWKELERYGIEDSKSTWVDIKEVAKDWKLWFILPFNIMGAVPIATFPMFLPIVLEGFGYSGNEANLMSVPPTLVGVIGLLIINWSSNRLQDRGRHIIASLLILLIGSILVVTIKHNVGRYISLCVVMFGALPVMPMTAAWLASNTPVPSKRILVVGLSSWSYVSGILGSQIFRKKYAPYYIIPFYVILAFNVTALIGYAAYWLKLVSVNRKRLEKVSRMTAEEVREEEANMTRLGDKKYTFLYQT